MAEVGVRLFHDPQGATLQLFDPLPSAREAIRSRDLGLPHHGRCDSVQLVPRLLDVRLTTSGIGPHAMKQRMEVTSERVFLFLCHFPHLALAALFADSERILRACLSGIFTPYVFKARYTAALVTPNDPAASGTHQQCLRSRASRLLELEREG